jgi:hypothetical protein
MVIRRVMRTRSRATTILRTTALAVGVGAVLAPSAAWAENQVLTFDGTVTPGGLDHVFVEFDVPAGFHEIQVQHANVTGNDTILDWGLDDPAGFRGWGGGNVEPAVVGDLAASRSYLAGPITPGKWRVVIGKAKLLGMPVAYHVVVTLRDTPSLPPQPERAPYVEHAPLSSESRWYAGDLHVHSIESGDARPPLDEVASFARSQGLDFVELSDHNTVSQLDFIDDVQSRHPDILLLPGVEYTTYAGHANGIGATTWVDHKIGQPGVDIASAAALFRAQGALFSINHPLYDLGNACIGCSWKHVLSKDAIDAVEIGTGGSVDLFVDQTLAFWDSICASGRHAAALGGSDDHSAGQSEGAFSTPIGTPTTYVYAHGLGASALLDGIRAGRTVVKLHGPSDPMAEVSSLVAAEGDTVHAETTLLHGRVIGGRGLQARWVKNGAAGEPFDLAKDTVDFDLEVRAPDTGEDRYRVEVLRGGHPTTVTSHLWVTYEKGVTGGLDDELRGGCNCRVSREGSSALVGLGGAVGLVVAAFARKAWARKRRRA